MFQWPIDIEGFRSFIDPCAMLVKAQAIKARTLDRMLWSTRYMFSEHKELLVHDSVPEAGLARPSAPLWATRIPATLKSTWQDRHERQQDLC